MCVVCVCAWVVCVCAWVVCVCAWVVCVRVGGLCVCAWVVCVCACVRSFVRACVGACRAQESVCDLVVLVLLEIECMSARVSVVCV